MSFRITQRKMWRTPVRVGAPIRDFSLSQLKRKQHSILTEKVALFLIRILRSSEQSSGNEYLNLLSFVIKCFALRISVAHVAQLVSRLSAFFRLHTMKIAREHVYQYQIHPERLWCLRINLLSTSNLYRSTFYSYLHYISKLECVFRRAWSFSNAQTVWMNECVWKKDYWILFDLN